MNNLKQAMTDMLRIILVVVLPIILILILILMYHFMWPSSSSDIGSHFPQQSEVICQEAATV